MAKTKVVIVGASHGGHESAIELLDKYSNVDVTIYEAGDFVSFMSCGMELFLEDQVTAQEDVRNFKPEDITSKGGHVFNNHEVTAIDADKKEVSVKDVTSGKTEQVAYDKLILSSGVTPTVIPVPGHDLDNIYAMRGIDWASKIKAAMTNDSIKNVAVIGAGYIGIEAAEVFTKAGKHVTLLDMIDRPLGNYLNESLTDVVTKELTGKGVELALAQSIQVFEGDKAVTGVKTADKTYPADLVICAAGVKPNTAWLDGTVNLTNRGFIDVNPYLQTNLPDVYAMGDAILPLSIPAGKPMPIALATTARREAQYVVDHIFEDTPSVPFKGVVGASALSVFDYHFASAGLNTTTAAKADVTVATSDYKDTLRPTYVPESAGNTDVYTSLTFDPLTHQILGGAVLSKYDITAQGNVLALAIAHKLTLEDLATADFFFQPGFDRQWSLLNLAAQHALGRAKF